MDTLLLLPHSIGQSKSSHHIQRQGKYATNVRGYCKVLWKRTCIAEMNKGQWHSVYTEAATYSLSCIFFLVLTARFYFLASYAVMFGCMTKFLPIEYEQKWLESKENSVCYFTFLWFDADNLGKLASHILKIVKKCKIKETVSNQ